MGHSRRVRSLGWPACMRPRPCRRPDRPFRLVRLTPFPEVQRERREDEQDNEDAALASPSNTVQTALVDGPSWAMGQGAEMLANSSGPCAQLATSVLPGFIESLKLPVERLHWCRLHSDPSPMPRKSRCSDHSIMPRSARLAAKTHLRAQAAQAGGASQENPAYEVVAAQLLRHPQIQTPDESFAERGRPCVPCRAAG